MKKVEVTKWNEGKNGNNNIEMGNKHHGLMIRLIKLDKLSCREQINNQSKLGNPERISQGRQIDIAYVLTKNGEHVT